MHYRSIFIGVLFGAVFQMQGCSAITVKPWDRDLLSQKKMQLDPAPLDSYLDEHIYYSKESSSGGSAVGGGGCGCN